MSNAHDWLDSTIYITDHFESLRKNELQAEQTRHDQLMLELETILQTVKNGEDAADAIWDAFRKAGWKFDSTRVPGSGMRYPGDRPLYTHTVRRPASLLPAKAYACDFYEQDIALLQIAKYAVQEHKTPS